MFSFEWQVRTGWKLDSSLTRNKSPSMEAQFGSEPSSPARATSSHEEYATGSFFNDVGKDKENRHDPDEDVFNSPKGKGKAYDFDDPNDPISPHRSPIPHEFLTRPSDASLASIAATGFAGSYLSTRDQNEAAGSSSSASTRGASASTDCSAEAECKCEGHKHGDNTGGSQGSGADKDHKSISDSINQHVYEGGLRYHAYRNGKYAFPNDENEQNRDDMKHAMTLLLCRGHHYYSPIDKILEEGGDVLDLGTGTGLWAIELGEKFDNTRMEGVDLSPIQPNYVPENVHFFVDDFEDEWIYDNDRFDFIHVRHTMHSVKDRQALFHRAYRHLKPGGYIEVQELHYYPYCDNETMTDDTPYAWRDFCRFLESGVRALGSELNAITKVPREMENAGFEEITRVTHKNPIGPWPRDKRLQNVGLYMRTAIMDGLRGLSHRPFKHGLGWTPLQIEMFLVDVRKHVMDAKFHTYFPFHVVYARKPLRSHEFNEFDGEGAAVHSDGESESLGGEREPLMGRRRESQGGERQSLIGGEREEA